MSARSQTFTDWASRETGQIGWLIRQVNDVAVVPSWCRLGEGAVIEKASGEFVTIADRRAEDMLSEQLTRLLPGSVTVGEEAVSRDPQALERLQGDAPVWIIDPIDGTENFIAGSPRFATLLALTWHGTIVASWIYAPMLRLLGTAQLGKGAKLNGIPVGPKINPPELARMKVALSRPRWWTPDTYRWATNLDNAGIEWSSFDTAGLGYLDLLTGRHDVMIMTWEHVWDHAAGMLLHTEADGRVIAADGRPFQLSGGNRLPLIAGPGADTDRRIRRVLSQAPKVPTTCGPHRQEQVESL